MLGSILDLLKDKKVTNLNTDQKTQLLEAQEYLQTHNIEMLFQELLAAVIETQPESAKEAIIEALQRKQEEQHFFNEQDFNVLFDNFDPFETKNVSVSKVVQGKKFEAIIHQSTQGDRNR